VTETRSPNVFEAFAAVMNEVQSIEKKDRNTAPGQGFLFRGIDAVMKAVGPALRQHGVFIIPTGTDLNSETYQTSKGTTMRNVTVTMGFRVYGPGGDYFDGVSFGEAADAGDKAVTKAQSVAYRTFLLQALTVPTGDPDPDASIHERAVPAPPKSEADIAREELLATCEPLGWTGPKLSKRFHDDYGKDIRTAEAGTIRGFKAALVSEAESQDAEEAS
jgi:hypothetical protein